MKLLTKTSLNLLSISLFIFLFGIIAFYYLLRKQVNENITLEMEKRKANIILQLESVHSSGQIPPNQNEKVLISDISNEKFPITKFSDTMIFNKSENKYIPYRQYGFIADFNERTYYIQIFKSLEETDNLIVRIFLIITIMFLVIIATLIIVNRYSSRQAWKVFYNTINKINNYDVNDKEQFYLEPADINEFDELNAGLNKMTERIRKDYLNLKEYTENASHEIQTPLAIISSKIELLLQSGDLKEKQYKAVTEAYNASNRLARLNKALLLLAKIENRQFPESRLIQPQVIIDNQLELLEDLIESKKIRITKKYINPISIQMNPYLAEILFSNLIKNAIRHNVSKGKVIFEISENNIRISNSGQELTSKSEDIFKRFHKSSKSPESLGLGLAIVQKICEVYGFDVKYSYENELHNMLISFPG